MQFINIPQSFVAKLLNGSVILHPKIGLNIKRQLSFSLAFPKTKPLTEYQIETKMRQFDSHNPAIGINYHIQNPQSKIVRGVVQWLTILLP
ncbi:hypothetical protein H6G18_08965 [Anabaena subtropica FACHB-260]|uniref:Uncharacterized protein n=1 Tax=Anabaena subtropica FACHB-260 TaxID=2692884 RepID=A0ABR8CNZ6_9NOST|nr:hypothetical protein [Anabaena subtropica FACHB-260]